MLATSGAAHAGREERDALSAYVRARVAGSAGVSEEAAKGYAAALALAPGNEALAARAFVQALEAGNRVLALNAARALERAGQSNTDVRLLLLTEALRTRDWKRASAHIDAIEKDEVFAFTAPILRAWTAVGSRRGDPLQLLGAGDPNELTAAYAAEHRPLLLLATKRREAGAAELLKIAEGDDMRAQRLRIAGAALLARKGDRARALTLLQGDAPALVRARALVEAQRPVPGDIATPAEGVAELMARVAGDLHRQRATALGLRFARLATFLAPDNSETWLVTAELLGSGGEHDAALVALAQVDSADPFADSASSARVRLLAEAGESTAALAEAEATAKANPSVTTYATLADIYANLERYDEAAGAYAQAIALLRPGESLQPEWTLRLLHGSALEQADRWPEAKAALQAAYKLAPDQPVVLNYLGYAQLERRENIPTAMKLIEEASRLQPDSPEITDSLGWAHYLTGDLPRAIELLERAAQGGPADPEINEHLGDAYYKAGRRFEARYAWKAALLYAEAQDAERLTAKIEQGWTPALASR